MNTVNLTKLPHDKKVGMVCEDIPANIFEDTMFILDWKPIWFYLRKMPKDMLDIAEFCNKELMSDRVPKSMMNRTSWMTNDENAVPQFSTILWMVQKNAFKRRYKNTISSVHKDKNAQRFVKGMALLAKRSEDLIKEYLPEQYEIQKKLIQEQIPKGYAFSELFTSSISNFWIACAYHVDNANIKNCLNAIIYKKRNADWWFTHVPDYDACPYSDDGAILVYPAWMSLHWVTPIKLHKKWGYRNSLVFYPLKFL